MRFWALKDFFLGVNVPMSLHVGLCWKALVADVALIGFGLRVGACVGFQLLLGCRKKRYKRTEYEWNDSLRNAWVQMLQTKGFIESGSPSASDFASSATSRTSNFSKLGAAPSKASFKSFVRLSVRDNFEELFSTWGDRLRFLSSQI